MVVVAWIGMARTCAGARVDSSQQVESLLGTRRSYTNGSHGHDLSPLCGSTHVAAETGFEV